jgi:hypothetical protein
MFKENFDTLIGCAMVVHHSLWFAFMKSYNGNES